MTKFELPKFAIEDEEAKRWFDDRDEIAADLLEPSRTGQLGEGTDGRRARQMRGTH